VSGDQPTVRVGFSGAYGFDRLEKTIATLAPLLYLREPALITIDLGSLVHIAPTSLALLVACLKRLQEDRLLLDGSAVIPPKAPPVAMYLERMNLIRELVGELPESFVRREAKGFRPGEHFEDDTDYAIVARSLTEAICERCDVDKLGRAAVRVCLDEVCENVIHHADTPLGGFAAAQGWPKSNREFEIGIVDLGVGKRASLTKNPDYAHIVDDAEAIRTALRPGVTSTPERNAGIGLFVTAMLLANNGGVIHVRSGLGAVSLGATNAKMQRPIAVPGTVVSLRAKMDKPLDLNTVYRQLDAAAAKHESDLQHAPADADTTSHDPQAS
jgi:hypothetical protein